MYMCMSHNIYYINQMDLHEHLHTFSTRLGKKKKNRYDGFTLQIQTNVVVVVVVVSTEPCRKSDSGMPIYHRSD